MKSVYLDKTIKNCTNREQLKLLLEDVSNVPMKTISGFAEAFYCTASIAYNTHYGEMAKDTLVYFLRIGYITEQEREQLEDIISTSVKKF